MQKRTARNDCLFSFTFLVESKKKVVALHNKVCVHDIAIWCDFDLQEWKEEREEKKLITFNKLDLPKICWKIGLFEKKGIKDCERKKIESSLKCKLLCEK